MTLSGALANFGLKANATPTSTNVRNSVEVGVPAGSTIYSDADVIYSFKVEATGFSDVATLDLDDGSVTQTTGTPTITDGDGNDFEGVDISMVTLYAVLVKNEGSGDVTVASSTTIVPGVVISPGAISLTAFSPSNASAITTSTMTLTLAMDTGEATVTVLGKSS